MENLEARTPPNNVDAEQSVIGSALLWTGEGAAQTLDRVRAIVRAEDFYRREHRILWEALCRLVDRGIAPDVVTIRAYVAGKDATTDFGEALVACMEAVPSSAHAEDYARIVRDQSDRRRAISALHELFHEPYKVGGEKSVTAAIVDRALELEADALDDDSPEGFDAIVTRAVTDYSEPSRRLATGLKGLDSIISGWPPGSFNVLAARPGGGKTTFALELMRAQGRAGVPVAMASLEMGRDELAPVMLCAEARIDSEKWTRRTLESFDIKPIEDAAAKLSTMPISIFDPDGMSLRDFRAWAHRRASQGCRLLVLDYIQLLEGDDDRKTRYEQYAQITREIKRTARRLVRRGYDTRLLVLSQLNREIEKAKRRKPQLSDLRESGTLEQDADSVYFLHPIERDKGETGKVVDVELIIAKHRSGRTGTASFRWDKAARYYTDLLGRPQPRNGANGAKP